MRWGSDSVCVGRRKLRRADRRGTEQAGKEGTLPSSNLSGRPGLPATLVQGPRAARPGEG